MAFNFGGMIGRANVRRPGGMRRGGAGMNPNSLQQPPMLGAGGFQQVPQPAPVRVAEPGMGRIQPPMLGAGQPPTLMMGAGQPPMMGGQPPSLGGGDPWAQMKKAAGAFGGPMLRKPGFGGMGGGF